LLVDIFRNLMKPPKEVLDEANHIEDIAVKGMYWVLTLKALSSRCSN